MSEPIKVDRIIMNEERKCASCNINSSKAFVISQDDTIYCTNCLFGEFVAKFPKYLDLVLKSRSNSLKLADENESPSELIGQCHRNSAILMSDIRRNYSISIDKIHLCSGKCRANNKTIEHYWVAIGQNDKYVYIDPEMPINEGGIWINDKIPQYYQIEEKISLDMKHKIPKKVCKWLRH